MLRRLTQFAILFVSIVCIVLLLSWVYIDHNEKQICRYISQQLTQQSGVPITIKQATLGFHPLPTIDFGDIELKISNRNLRLTINQIRVTISWKHLLQGQLICSNISIVQPSIYLQRTTSTNAISKVIDKVKKQQLTTGRTPLNWLTPTIRSLVQQAEIVDATIIVKQHAQYGNDTTEKNLEVHGLDININIADANKLSLSASGQLIQQNTTPATLAIFGYIKHANIDSAIQQRNWLATEVQVQVDIDNLASNNIALPPKYRFNGNIDLDLNIKGQPSSGIELRSSLKALNNNQFLLIDNHPPLPVKQISLASTLQLSDDTLHFSNTELLYNSIRISMMGKFTDLNATPHLYAELRSNQIPLSTILPWAAKSITEQLPPNIGTSTLQCKSLVIGGPLKQLTATNIVFADITYQYPQLDLQKIYPAGFNPGHTSGFNADLKLRNTKLSLITSPLEINSSTLHLAGPIKITAQESSINRWQITADLTPLAFDASKIVHKDSGEKALFKADLQRQAATDSTPLRWALHAAEISIPEYHLFADGFYTKNDYQLNIRLPKFELATLSNKIPILQHMKLKGTVGGSYQLRQHDKQPWHGTGKVTLTDCAISPTYVIAPIHNINGTVALDNFSATCKGLAIVLGSSPMQVDAHIADLRHTVAEIHATGNGVIANDLVFHTPNAVLNNLDGRINIHAHGIDFIQASVDLVGGTHAMVSGKLLFHGPLLELDIDTDYADIDEIIALWKNEKQNTAAPANSAQAQTSPGQFSPATIQEHNEFIHINASVKNGIISGFEFQDARGKIHYGHEGLRIAPLTFLADNGNGEGVIFISKHGAEQYLQITGKVIDIDAQEIYQQVFKQRGILTGTLTSNFTIEGPLGTNFTPNSQGHFHFQIKKGIIRQFKSLSKAFSLLNVKQLFAFNLPKMDTEGMPFSLITGNIALSNGVLSTNDLDVDSPAMDMVIIGSQNLVTNEIDTIMGIRPLGTVDTVINNIPVAGWLLGGDEKSLVATHFKVTGQVNNPKVTMLAMNSISKKVLGFFKRTFSLPATIINEPGKVLRNNKQSRKDLDSPTD